MTAHRLVDLCAGAGAITLRLFGGERALPPTGWMGGKRRQAPAILDALGVDRASVATGVMVDSSSWGWAWSVVLSPEGGRVADVLDGWAGEDPRALWARLVAEPLPADPIEAVAAWLWVQARASSNTPTWWCPVNGWQMGEKWGQKRRSPATMGLDGRKVAKQKGIGRGELKGPRSSATVADRIRAARGVLVGRVQVLHADARDFVPEPGDVVVFDPPYQGCTAYEHALPRADVLAIAERLRADGCRVAVCEAVPLPLEGWHHLEVSHLGRRGAGPEWLTLSHPPARYQVPMFARGASSA